MAELLPVVAQLQAAIQKNVDALAKDPSNTTLRTRIIKDNVIALSTQMNTDTKEAGNVLKTYTAAYAKSQNIDPQSILDAMTKEEQNILNYSASNPTLYGMSLSSANKLASYLGLGSGFLLSSAIVVFCIALFTVGPEAAATIAAGEGVVATIAASLGTPIIAAGGFLFLLSQFLGHLSSGIPMMTKQMIDNGSIGPGLRISALKDAEELKAKFEGTDSPGPFAAAQFSDYAKAIESVGVTQFKDPASGKIVQYTRKTLANAIIYIYGQEIIKGQKSTFTTVKTALSPYLQGKSGSVVTSSGASGSSNGQAGSVGVLAPKSTTPKVFTGVISQGVVSNTPDFVARPDDLISSVQELKDAAANNLVQYLAALPGKVIYEVKVVSSITTADGFKQTGVTQKIASGTTKAGATTYKTVTNKFATLILYVLTDKGTRAKIKTIVLGPVDSARLQVSQNDLTDLQAALPKEVTTSDPTAIVSVQQSPDTQPAPVVVTSVPVVQNPRLGETHYYSLNSNGTTQYTTLSWGGNVPYGYTSLTKADYIAGLTQYIANGLAQAQKYPIIQQMNGGTFRYATDGTAYVGNNLLDAASAAILQKQLSDVKNGVGIYADGYNDGSFAKFQAYAPTPSEQWYTQRFFNTLPAIEQTRLKNLYPGYNFQYDAAPVSGTAPVVNKSGIYQIEKSDVAGGRELIFYPAGTTPNASLELVPITLSEWYQTQGQQLPSVADRATLYQNLGLGQGSYYTGTAEQNAKLLAALIQQAG